MNQIYVVYKRKGMTSRDVVNQVGKKLGTKKIGHTGTLDPLAEGVLVLLVERYTKLNPWFVAKEKEYLVTVKMGLLTDTLDLEGTILKEDKKIASKEQLENLFKTFPKTYLQEVPLYSAVKVRGKKLYQYAREKKGVVLPKREVHLYQLELLSVDQETFTFRTVVSKGTYIRSLVRDLGESLGLLFTMSALVRTRQGTFTLQEAVPIEEIENQPPILLEDVLNIPIEVVDSVKAFAIQNGQKLKNEKHYDSVLFVDSNKMPLAIYQKKGDLLCVHTMLGGKNQ